VGTNLKSALKELRAQRLLLLWVDALCINQTDLLERGLQVMRMGLIYSRAAEVVVWLGEEADDSAIAMSEIASTGPKNHLESLEWPWRSQPWVLESRTRAAVMALFQRPYWKRWVYSSAFLAGAQKLIDYRVWIIQEVSKARRLLVICGTHSVLWENLSRFLDNTGIRLPEASSLQKFRDEEIGAVRYGTTRPSLYEALIRSQHCLASDDRDKIYAILGLASDGADIVPTPNYRQPLAKVYFDVFMGMLLRDGQYAYSSQEAATAALSGLVPDWTDITRGLPLFLVKLLANSSKDIRTPETMGYVDAWPKQYKPPSFLEEKNLTLPISISGLQTRIYYIDTLTDVTTRFKTISTRRSLSRSCLLVHGNERDACTGRNFLFALWHAIRAIRVKYESTEGGNFLPNRLKFEKHGLELDNAVQAHTVVPSLAYLCLQSEWERPINHSSARDVFWNWLSENQNLVYKQRTIRYWIEAYGLSREYLDFAKDLEAADKEPSFLQRLFPLSRAALSSYLRLAPTFLEGINRAGNCGLRLAIGSKTVELMPREVRQGDIICRIQHARKSIVLRPEKDGYRFVAAVWSNYSLIENLGTWHGWRKPRPLTRKWVRERRLDVVLSFGYPEYLNDSWKGDWQIINIC
jgi:hypothetical protein